MSKFYFTNYLTKTQQILTKTQNLAKQRQHKLLTETYNGIKSNLEVFCLRHKTHNKTTYKKYMYSKWGCLCCAKDIWTKPRSNETREKISKAHKNKPKNYESWLKGKTGSKHPSYKHGLGNTRVINSEQIQRLNVWTFAFDFDRSFKSKTKAKEQAVLKQSNFRCFLTNLKTTATDPLVCHHIYSWCDNINFRYAVSNGVALKRSVHKKFHDHYGFGKNTLAQFKSFCKIEYAVDFKRRIKEDDLELNLHLLKLITLQQIKTQEVYTLAQKRGHKILQAKYQNAHSKLEIFCTKHHKSHCTTFTNYKKSKTGCPCCGYSRD